MLNSLRNLPHNLGEMISLLDSVQESELSAYGLARYERLSSMVEWNKALKSCQTWDDFAELMDRWNEVRDVWNMPTSTMCLQTKKTHTEVESFSHLAEDYPNWGTMVNRVHYCICDGYSTGKAYVKNLHRILYFG